jgi:hypothetical protein
MNGDGALTVVGTFRSSFDAAFARSLLQSAGIEAFICDDIPGGRYSYIKIKVPAGDEREARQILQAGQRAGSGAAGDDVAGAVRVGFVGGAMGGGLLGAFAGWM